MQKVIKKKPAPYTGKIQHSILEMEVGDIFYCPSQPEKGLLKLIQTDHPILRAKFRYICSLQERIIHYDKDGKLNYENLPLAYFLHHEDIPNFKLLYEPIALSQVGIVSPEGNYTSLTVCIVCGEWCKKCKCYFCIAKKDNKKKEPKKIPFPLVFILKDEKLPF